MMTATTRRATASRETATRARWRVEAGAVGPAMGPDDDREGEEPSTRHAIRVLCSVGCRSTVPALYVRRA